MFKKLAAATLMLCAAGGALATPLDLGVVPFAPNIRYEEIRHDVPDSFTDTFTFTVPDSALGVSANILAVLNTGGEGYARHISGLVYDILDMDNNLKGHYLGGLTISRTVLMAGEYTLVVKGIADGVSGGTYGVNLSVSPVPEPATYGMMLVGLGLLGFASRRRDASNDKFR